MKDLRDLPAYFDNATPFRAWIQGLDAQLLACGLVATTDTGQLSPGSALLNGAGVIAGYKIYRFNDDLQATSPVFIKVEFGSGSTIDKPSLRLTISTATNGAGVMTGQVTPAMSLGAIFSKAAGSVLPSYCCGDGSRLALCTNLDAVGGNYEMFIFIERPRNANGSASGAVIFYWAGVGNAFRNGILPPVGAVPAGNTTSSLMPMLYLEKTVQMSTLVGTEVALAPMFAVYGRPYPLMSPLGYMQSDIGELVPFTTTWLGGVHTFMPLGDGGPNAFGVATFNMAMIWE